MTIVSNKVEAIGRKNWIDWMKAIGITAVVWGHFFPEGMSGFIYAFNVPLFFVVSGYLTRQDRGFKESAGKVAVGLAIPYILLALIKVAGYAIKHIADGKALWALLFLLVGVHDYNGISGCNNLWFVYTLILIKLLFPPIRRCPTVIVLLAICCLIGGRAYSDLDVGVAWAVPDVLLAFPFFALGYMLRHYGSGIKALLHRLVENPRRRNTVLCVATVALAAITYVLGTLNGEAHMFSAHYGSSIVLFTIAALTGTAMVFTLSMLLDGIHWSGLRAISSGTIVILTFHRELIHPLSKLIGHSGFGLAAQNAVIFVSSVAIVIVFIPVILLLERYAPILLGKRR